MQDTYYDGIAAGYNELHREEQLRKLALVAQHMTFSGQLLDVGCGTGISTDYWTATCECVGIDPSAELIAQNTDTKSTFIIGNAEQLPFDDQEFDVVVSFTALQNCTDIDKAVAEIIRVGQHTFALTWLKNSAQAQAIETALRTHLGEPTQALTDAHDTIWLYKSS